VSASAPAGEPSPRPRRWLRVGAGLAVALVCAGGAGVAWLHARLKASLPLETGEHALAGLSAPVRIERDALGVPVVRGRSRSDVARATGFLHAQERFFQMDLLRRRAAGELAALVGRPALKLDREVRVLRLRAVARRTLQSLPAGERTLLDAYAQGVAAGLAALRAAPFEYLLLRSRPEAWRPEDSLLVALAMYLRLQGDLAVQESTLGLLHDTLPRPLFEFLTPKGTEWDAPLVGEAFQPPPIPGPEVVDLRRRAPAHPAAEVPVADGAEPLPFGSNNWAVAGSHTATGDAIVANDMHLGLSVPNTWYRASLVVDDGGRARRVTGVTLPGTPLVIAGSNGALAWGFTNSECDWADLVVLEADPGDPDAYRTPQGPRRFEKSVERIEVRGAAAVELEVLSTIWGPVIDKDHLGRRRALAWVALRDGGLNLGLLGLETARSVEAALAVAAGAGLPNQNLVAADANGRIGWTIIGRIPRRFGHDGRLPSSWADGTRGWDGWLTPAEYPRIVDPPSGRVFSANARVVSGEPLARLGFGGYALGARQRQIRDDLMAIEHATEADMLRVQLDDRALFLARWQRLLLGVLTPQATEGHPRRAEARRLVEAWGERAGVASAGYRIVRAFRQRVAEKVLAPLLAPCRSADPEFDYLGQTEAPRAFRQWEGPVWALVSGRPAHLLDAGFESWDALFVAALDDVLERLARAGARLSDRTWGERNTPRIQHPLSRALPGLGWLLDMKPVPLPGDGNMPRVQTLLEGASERFAVSPGHEERGYFHMPAGQSGNPLSPHYADGHQAWVKGEPTPFLPGPAVSVLTLLPAR
jgi:penicillin amidase